MLSHFYKHKQAVLLSEDKKKCVTIPELLEPCTYLDKHR